MRMMFTFSLTMQQRRVLEEQLIHTISQQCFLYSQRQLSIQGRVRCKYSYPLQTLVLPTTIPNYQVLLQQVGVDYLPVRVAKKVSTPHENHSVLTYRIWRSQGAQSANPPQIASETMALSRLRLPPTKGKLLATNHS